MSCLFENKYNIYLKSELRILCGFFSDTSSPTTTGCPAIQFSSDTNCPESAQVLQAQGSAPRDCPTSDGSCKQRLWAYETHTYVLQTITNSGVLWFLLASHFSRVRLFLTLWTVAHQVPLTMGFSKQED